MEWFHVIRLGISEIMCSYIRLNQNLIYSLTELQNLLLFILVKTPTKS